MWDRIGGVGWGVGRWSTTPTHPHTHTHTHTHHQHHHHTPSAFFHVDALEFPCSAFRTCWTHTHTRSAKTNRQSNTCRKQTCTIAQIAPPIPTPPLRSLRSLAKSQRAPAEMRDNGTAALQPLIAERIIFFTITTGWGRGGSVCSCMSIILRKQNSQGRQQRQREGEGTEWGIHTDWDIPDHSNAASTFPGSGNNKAAVSACDCVIGYLTECGSPQQLAHRYIDLRVSLCIRHKPPVEAAVIVPFGKSITCSGAMKKPQQAVNNRSQTEAPLLVLVSSLEILPITACRL